MYGPPRPARARYYDPLPLPLNPKNPLENERINGIITHPSRTTRTRTFLYLNAWTLDYWFSAAPDLGPQDMVIQMQIIFFWEEG